MNKTNVIDALRKAIAYLEQPEEPPHKKGYDFERRFAAMCESRKLSCFRAPRGHYDYVVNGVRVQCKKLTPCDGFICVQPGSGPYYPAGSFDALAVEVESDVYVVPEREITRTKNGSMLRADVPMQLVARYLDAWWVLEQSQCPVGFIRQLVLIREDGDDGR